MQTYYLEVSGRNLRNWSQEKVQTGNSAACRARSWDGGEHSPESACHNWNDPWVPLLQETKWNHDILLK